MAFENGLDTVEARMLPISKVEPRMEQPRKDFDDMALQELAESIAEHGVLQPLTVRPIDNGYYQIIAGERRWRASRLAGLLEIPARIIEVDDKKAQELALIENLQREDLNPIEEARGYKMLTEVYGMTQDAIAKSMGKGRSTVTNSLRLLSLPPAIISMMERGELSSGHGRALLAIPNETDMLKIAQQTAEQGLTVRETEMLAYSLQKKKSRGRPKKHPGIDYAAIVSRELGDNLGRKVNIVEGRKKGRIELEYYDADDREALINALRSIHM